MTPSKVVKLIHDELPFVVSVIVLCVMLEQWGFFAYVSNLPNLPAVVF